MDARRWQAGALAVIAFLVLHCTSAPKAGVEAERWNPANAKFHCSRPRPGFQDLTSAPLFDLIAHPQFYSGCRVSVAGFLDVDEAAGGHLYVSREDQRLKGDLFGGVALILYPHGSGVTLADMKQANGAIVRVQGRFLDIAAGPAIEKIEEFDIVSK